MHRSSVILPSSTTGLPLTKNILNSHRVPRRILVSGNILNRRRVKDRNIRHHPRTQDTAIHESDSAGGERGHLSHSSLHAHNVLGTHVLRHYARKGSECPWMRFGRTQ